MSTARAIAESLIWRSRQLGLRDRDRAIQGIRCRADYDDMAGWRHGEYVGMSLDEVAARAAAASITHLQPLAQ